MASSGRAGGFFAPATRQAQDAPAAAPPAPPPRPTGGFIGGGDNGDGNGCDRCGDPRPHAISTRWLSAFGIALCTACRARDELVSKSAAKERYLVTDADLAALGTLQRDNPHHRQFAPMKLYLASQVAAVAARKHGGAEGLQAARTARVGAKLEQRATKKRKEQSASEAAEQTRLRLEREAEERLAELEAQAQEDEDEEEEEDTEEGGVKKEKKKAKKKQRKVGVGGRTEVVELASGMRGRRFGEGLAIVEDVEEI